MVIALVAVCAVLVGFVAGLVVKRSCVFDAGVLAGRLQTENAHGWPTSDPVIRVRRRAWLTDRKPDVDPFVAREMYLFRATDHQPAEL